MESDQISKPQVNDTLEQGPHKCLRWDMTRLLVQLLLLAVAFIPCVHGVSIGRVDVNATPTPVKICFDLPSTHTGVSVW
jgi:hypothetical protein